MLRTCPSAPPCAAKLSFATSPINSVTLLHLHHQWSPAIGPAPTLGLRPPHGVSLTCYGDFVSWFQHLHHGAPDTLNASHLLSSSFLSRLNGLLLQVVRSSWCLAFPPCCTNQRTWRQLTPVMEELVFEGPSLVEYRVSFTGGPRWCLLHQLLNFLHNIACGTPRGPPTRTPLVYHTETCSRLLPCPSCGAGGPSPLLLHTV